MKKAEDILGKIAEMSISEALQSLAAKEAAKEKQREATRRFRKKEKKHVRKKR